MSTSQRIPRNSWNHQKLEDARKHPYLEPLKRAWRCQHLDLWLPAFRTVIACISLVSSHLVCGALLQQPQERTGTSNICKGSLIWASVSFCLCLGSLGDLAFMGQHSTERQSLGSRSQPPGVQISVPPLTSVADWTVKKGCRISHPPCSSYSGTWLSSHWKGGPCSLLLNLDRLVNKAEVKPCDFSGWVIKGGGASVLLAQRNTCTKVLSCHVRSPTALRLPCCKEAQANPPVLRPHEEGCSPPIPALPPSDFWDKRPWTSPPHILDPQKF